jgi:SAM-dependent methyltransferase
MRKCNFDGYSNAWYEGNAGDRERAEKSVIAEGIEKLFAPKRVLDIACSSAGILRWFNERGRSVTGLDCPHAFSNEGWKKVLEIPIEKVVSYDLQEVINKETWPKIEPADVCVSLETGEHLPPEVSLSFVEYLTSLAPIIVFSAAYPGLGGCEHINVHPPEFWTEKFEACGFEYDDFSTEVMLGHMRGKMLNEFYMHLRVFRKKGYSPQDIKP